MAKKLRTPLDIAIQAANNATNRAKSAFSFNNARTFGKMLEAFGYPIGQIEYIYDKNQLDKAIVYKDIDRYGNNVRDQAIAAMVDTSSVLQPDAVTENYLDELTLITSVSTQVDAPIIDFEVVRDDIYDEAPPKQKARLLGKQTETAQAIVKDTYEGMRGQLLMAGTGLGKTYVVGSVLRNLLDHNFFKEKTRSPWPIVYITKASVVTQTYRVLADEFGIRIGREVQLLNIEQLRSSFGAIYLERKLAIIDGREYISWVWRPILHPCLFILDECQQVKNEDSEQSQIMQAANDIETRYNEPVYQLYVSATPFTRVAEAKCFAVATRVRHNFGATRGLELTNKDWPLFATAIAHPAEPLDHSPAAIDRLTTVLEPYIKRMKNMRPKFHARNGVEIIHFRNKEERDEYDNYYSKYLAQAALIQGTEVLTRSQSHFALLARFTVFRRGAEGLRAQWLAAWIVDTWNQGYAPCLAVCFKDTIIKVVRILIEDYGWSRADISIIWGGAIKAKQDAKKQTAKAIMSNAELQAALKSAGLSLETLGLDYTEDELKEKTEEEIKWEREHNMGAQNPQKRQIEVDRFQRGKSRCCIFTYKSGGVGLSLHHHDVSGRPRKCVLTPVYSAMEAVQGLGRCARLTSLSDTEQKIVFYGGTIEQEVAARVSLKLRCLMKVVRQRESWEDIIIGQKVRELAAPTMDAIDEELDEVYVEDEE